MRLTGWVVEPTKTGLDLELTESTLGSGTRVDLCLRNPADEPVVVDKVRLFLDMTPSRVLEQGWQSWSVVRRCRPEDVRPERAGADAWLRGQLHADPDTAGRVVAGDQFLVTDRGVVGFIDGRHNFSTVIAPPGQPLQAVALLDGIEIPAGGERILDPLWHAEGKPGPLYSELVSHWGAESEARAATPSELGWCSWYEYFTNLRPEHLRSNLPIAADHGIKLFQIDDGWQAEIGLWNETIPSWDVDVAALAAEITKSGLRPGIWTAPFAVVAGGSVAREHPDWLVGEPTDAPSSEPALPLRALYNPVWRSWCNALDTTNPAVLDHLRATYAKLTEWGYTFHKIDFAYIGAVAGARMADRTMTRAEALTAGLRAIREGAGESAFLAGSGCPFGPAVGVVDSMRVSEDVAQYWEPRGAVDAYPEATPCARNAVSASVLRAPFHRRLFAVDPDCVLLRPTGTLLTAIERRVITHAAMGNGGFVILSDNLERYGAVEWGRVARMAALQADADGPLDIRDPFATPIAISGPALLLTIAPDQRYSRLVRSEDDALLLP